MSRLSEGSGKPLETLIQTITGGSASGLDVLRRLLVEETQGYITARDDRSYPGTLAQAVKAELVCDLSSVHGVLQYELVSGCRN